MHFQKKSLHLQSQNGNESSFGKAGVLKLVDNPDLGSGAERRGGSSPFARTKKLNALHWAFFVHICIVSATQQTAQQPCTQKGGPQLQSPYHRPLHRCHPTPVKTDTSHASRHDSPHTHDFSPYFLQVCTQIRPITAQNDIVTRLFPRFLAGVYPNQADYSPKRHRHTTFPPFSCRYLLETVNFTNFTSTNKIWKKTYL